MYKSFRVKNFRCFKDLQINDLGRVNLIAGKNNTGKTALLEAMHVLAGTYSGQVLLRNPGLRRALLRPENESETRNQLSWSTIFFGLDTGLAIELSASERIPNQTVDISQSRIKLSIQSVSFSNDTDDESRYKSFGYQYDVLPDDTDILKLCPSLDGRPTYLALIHSGIVYPRLKPSRFRPSQLLHARTGASARDIERRFNRIQKAKKIDALVTALELIEPRIKDVRINTDGWRSHLMTDIGLDYMIAMSESGEGMNRLSDIILAMHEAKGGIIFIDEIENGIHHTVQKNIWRTIGKIAQEEDTQVFATTHSYEMIEAAHEAFKDDEPYEFRFHRLNRRSDEDEKDTIEAITYNRAGVEAFIRSQYEVRG